MSRTMLSWNVNGIRSVERKNFRDIFTAKPWLVAAQEVKAAPGDIPPDLDEPEGYHSWWDSGLRKGYSGVAAWCRDDPLTVTRGIGIDRFDTEGRTLILEFERFFLFNLYFPNGKMSLERLNFKLDFYRAFFETVNRYRERGKSLIVCGDFNTAHREIDIARPKENSLISGFLPEERALIDQFIGMGFIDTFREFHPEAGQYSYWDYKTRARERNVGWRIDYFFIDRESRDHVKDAFIRGDVTGSDHCPVGITVDF